MKKSIASFLLAIVTIISLSTFAVAGTFGSSTTSGRADEFINIHIKSFINMTGAGMCMDVAGGFTTSGTPIVQFPCQNSTNQRFTIEQITDDNQRIIRSSLNPNMCVGIMNNVNANPNELLRLLPCRNPSGFIPQGVRWFPSWVIFKVNLRFRAAARSVDGQSTCIDVPNGSPDHSLWLQLFTCHSGDNQKWTVF